MGRTATRSASARRAPVDVVDTVGAGDAFGAGLLRGLWERDRLEPDRVGAMDDRDLADVVSFAVAVATLQCTRQGSSPSTLAEVAAFIAADTM